MNLLPLARACGFELCDYGTHRGNGALLASGSGLMMAVMDSAPVFRWCVDIDSARSASALDLAIVLARRVSLLGLVGWFSVDTPVRFLEILSEPLPCRVVAYGGNVPLGVPTLKDFLHAVAPSE